MESEGMVAVVRGLKDSGLAVTVVDGDRRYSLIPNTEMAQRVNAGCQDTINYQCNSSAQAVDGRYTSTYQAAHCNVSPTSPSVHVGEFPPQRPKGCVRHGNFEVGGAGSGEKHVPIKKAFIGHCAAGTEKGSSPGCNSSPQNSFASRQFVSSLRKYPCLSPERSSEIVERLVNYSPTKHLSGISTHRAQYSPTRLSDNFFAQDRAKSPSKGIREASGEPDIATRIKKIERATKDKRMESAGVNGDFKMSKEYEVRYLKEIPKRASNFTRVIKGPTILTPTPKGDNKTYDLPNNYINSVDTESQAAVMMVSREVATVTRPAPSRRTVAVPLTPSSSAAKDEGECSCVPCSFSIDCKFSETVLSPSTFQLISRKSVQTICSCVELRQNRNIVSDDKRSRSHHHLRITNDDFRWDALELLQDMSLGYNKKPSACHKLIDKWLDLDKYNIKVKIGEVINKETVDYCNNLVNIDINRFKNRNERIESWSVILDHKLDNVIKNWLSKIKLQVKDLLGRPIKRDAIVNTASNEIKTLVFNQNLSERELKSEIIKVMEGILIDDRCNVQSYLNKPVDILLNQIHNLMTQDGDQKKTSKKTHLPQIKRKKTLLTDSNFKNLIEDVLLEFLEKSNQHMSVHQILDVEDELVDLLAGSIDYIRYGIDSHIRVEVQNILIHCGEMTNHEAYVITKKLFHRLQEILNDENFSNTYATFPINKDSSIKEIYKDNDSILPIDEQDIRSNLEQYTSQISKQIDEWLTILNLRKFRDKGLRQVVVNDLAGEIIDRHNYLELNPNSRGTDVNELEQLKFQIFKWINKLVGEDVTIAIEHAQDLMDKIKGVPVPMLVSPQELSKKFSVTNINDTQGKPSVPQLRNNLGLTELNRETVINVNGPEEVAVPERITNHPPSTERLNNLSHDLENVRSSPERHSKTQTSYINPQCTRKEGQPTHVPDSETWYSKELVCQPTSDKKNSGTEKIGISPNACQQQKQPPNSIPIPPCCMRKEISPVTATLKKLNEEYDNYVQQWLLSIPIPATNSEEQKNADLSRLSIYSGIWKAITKLKFDPKIYNNPYYYHDVLDDEIEKVLQNLPHTKELQLIKHRLKEELIDKTVHMDEQIKSAAALSCFKQQLIDNLDNHLPKNSKLTIEEELAKNDLVDDYILFTTYKQDNDVTGNVFRHNFLKNIEKLAGCIQNNHGDEFKSTDHQTYVNELINTVSKVPVPDSDAIKEEACEILIQKEIDRWLTDLPVKTEVNHLEKRSLRNVLANKVTEIGKQMNLSDCNAMKELQAVLPKHLDKLPLQDDTNLIFFIEELVNRLRVMPKHVRRKSVSFQMPQNYEEFSRHMPGCSSFLGPSRIMDDTSYMIMGGEIVKNPDPKSWINLKQPTIPEEQWLSMEQTAAPQGILDWSQLPSRSVDTHSKSLAPGQPVNEVNEIMNYSRNISYNSPVQNVEPDAYVQDPRNSLSNSSRRRNSGMSRAQQKPRLQEMAGGGLGVLGTSQVAGSSGVSACNIHGSLQSPRTSNSYKEPERSTSPATKDVDADKHDFYLSTDSKGIKEVIDETKGTSNPLKLDAETITCPYEMGPILSPVECAGGCHYIPQDNNFLCQRSHYCIPRQYIFQGYSNGPYRCQRGQRSDDLECDTVDDRRCLCVRYRLDAKCPCASCESIYTRYPTYMPMMRLPHYCP